MLASSAKIGPLVSAIQQRRVLGYIESGYAEGARAAEAQREKRRGAGDAGAEEKASIHGRKAPETVVG